MSRNDKRKTFHEARFFFRCGHSGAKFLPWAKSKGHVLSTSILQHKLAEGEPPTPPSQRLSGLLFVTHVSVNKQGAQMGFSCPELVEGEASEAINVLRGLENHSKLLGKRWRKGHIRRLWNYYKKKTAVALAHRRPRGTSCFTSCDGMYLRPPPFMPGTLAWHPADKYKNDGVEKPVLKRTSPEQNSDLHRVGNVSRHCKCSPYVYQGTNAPYPVSLYPSRHSLRVGALEVSIKHGYSYGNTSDKESPKSCYYQHQGEYHIWRHIVYPPVALASYSS